jgi:tetratricopeptide (TPR) repeat protein
VTIARLIAVSLLFWMALPAAPAHTGETAPKQLSADAKTHRDLGLLLYRQKEYARAVEQFKMAYAIESSAELLFALAQSQRRLGDCEAAAQTYEAFLQTGPPKEQADMAVRNLERCRRTNTVSAPARAAELTHAVASVDPKLSRGALPEARESAPALIRPEVVAPEAGLVPLPTKSENDGAAAPDRVRWYRDWIGLGLAGAGIAAVAISAGLFGAGAAGIDAINHTRGYDNFIRESQQGGHFMALQYAGVAVGLAGGLLLAGGAVRFAVIGLRARRALHATVTPAPDGVRLGVTGGF